MIFFFFWGTEKEREKGRCSNPHALEKSRKSVNFRAHYLFNQRVSACILCLRRTGTTQVVWRLCLVSSTWNWLSGIRGEGGEGRGTTKRRDREEEERDRKGREGAGLYVSNEAFNPTWSSTLFFISLSVDRIVDSPRWPFESQCRAPNFNSIHFARFLKKALSPLIDLLRELYEFSKLQEYQNLTRTLCIILSISL